MSVDRLLAPEKFIYLRDQEPLTMADRAVAEGALAYIKKVCESRERRIRELGLDPAIWLPSAFWAYDQPFYRNFHALFDRQNLPLLRIFTHHFTGYRLGSLSFSEDAVPGETPDEIDRRLEERHAAADTRIGKYEWNMRVFGLPDELHISPPRKFGEVGWQWRGKLVNHDTVAYLERIAVLYRAGLLDPGAPNSMLGIKRPRILEIGGGHGGLAYFIKQIFKDARYTIVDLPESLAFSSIYLGALYQDQENCHGLASALAAREPGFSFLPNYEFPELIESGAEFDLVINTLSFSEMSRHQVRAYCKGISKSIGKHGILFEQNQNNRHVGLLNAQEYIRRSFTHRLAVGVSARHEEIMRFERGSWERARDAVADCLSGLLGREQHSLATLEQGYANIWSNHPILAPARLASHAGRA